MKKNIAAAMEWGRPIGICLVFYFAYYFGKNPVEVLHILGPFIVIVMAGTISFESLVLGEIASAKIGYKPNRAYQIQSGLNNMATTLAAIMVYALNWGKYADATVLSVYLFFQLLSGCNHARTIFTEKNYTKVNIMRPILTVVLLAALVPHIVMAMKYNRPDLRIGLYKENSYFFNSAAFFTKALKIGCGLSGRDLNSG